MSLEELESGVTPNGDPRLNRMLSLLESMDARLSRLESQVAGLSETPPAGVARAATTMDGAIAAAAERGMDVDARLRTSLHLLEALTEPRTVDVVERLIGRLDMVDQTLMTLQQMPDLAAGAVDTVDRLLAAASASGIDLNGRMQASVALLDRLTDPDTVEALLTLTDRLGDMAQAADFNERVERWFEALQSLTDPTVIRLLQTVSKQGSELAQLVDALAESGLLGEDGVEVVGATGAAVVRTRTARPAPVGAMGVLTAVFDPDVQRSLGFVVALARAFGKRLD